MTDQSIVNAMPIADNAQTISTAISIPQRLILGHDVDWWNTAMVVSLVCAGLIALAVALTTTVVVKLQRQVDADTKAAFARYKLDAERDINDAKKEALNAQLALEQYKAPRTIEQSKQEEFIEALKPSAPQQYMLSVAAGREAANLVCLLDELISKAGWKRFHQQGTFASVGTDCGPLGMNVASDVHVRVAVTRSDETTVAADRLLSALAAAGIKAHPGQDPVNVPNSHVVVIMVGAKL
jgi:hypothetical protein